MAVKLNFTKKALEALPVPKSGRAIYRDEQTVGLVLKIEAGSGSRSFAWYRKARNYPTWKNIGAFPDLSIEDARHRAAEKNVALARWKAGNYEGPNPFEKPVVLTLDTLVEQYCSTRLASHAKNPEYAAKRLRWFVARYMPALRSRRIGSIGWQEIAALHRRIGVKHRRTANAAVKQLRTLYAFARRTKLWAGENPAENHELYRENERDRFLQPDELPGFWQALSRAKNQDLKDFVNLSLWCGARKMDTMSMRWQDVSLADNRWTIPNPKSRKKYVIALTPEASGILKERLARAEALERKTGIARSSYVFPSHGRTGHLTDLKKSWKKLLENAGLEYKDAPELKLRVHDLRRTKGSWMAGTGASLPIIGKQLGHQSSDATEIYARLDLDPVREASMAADAAILAAMKKRLPKPAPRLLPAAKQKKAARG